MAINLRPRYDMITEFALNTTECRAVNKIAYFIRGTATA